MATTEASGPSSPATGEKKYLTVRQAAFIGVGAMVGAGIFALLGAAGEVAGACWSTWPRRPSRSCPKPIEELK